MELLNIRYTLVKFQNISLKTREGAKLRGYFANKYQDEEIMHNHNGEKVLYKYPKVQYKVIDSIPIICGVEEGADIIAKVGFNTDELCIENKIIDAYQKEILKQSVDFGIADNYLEYEFLTPWVSLNQKNIRIYQESNNIEREEILKRILVGNILSLSKGLNYSVPEKLYVWIDLYECAINFKNINMIGFKGRFRTNFLIPDYLGIGKSVSRGFGTIKMRC